MDKNKIHVLNPTSIEQSILRTSLLPDYSKWLSTNADHQNTQIAGFEIGRIHFKEKEQYREQSIAAIVLAALSPHRDTKAQTYDFFDLKRHRGKSVHRTENFPPVEFRKSSFPTLHPGRQAALYAGQLEIGSLGGKVHPEILRRLDFRAENPFC